MIRTTYTLAVFLLLTLCTTFNANAAIVVFAGQLTSGNGIIGAVPPTLPFSLSLDFTSSGPGIGTINSGLFTNGLGNIAVVGGDILLIESGANDQALFSINTSAPAGAISITATGNGIANNQVTTQNLVALINTSTFTSVSANFGAGGNYTGSISTAVPEPNTVVLLSGATLVLTFFRRRKFGE